MYSLFKWTVVVCCLGPSDLKNIYFKVLVFLAWASVSAALLPGCPAHSFCNVTVCCIISVLFEQ